MEDDIIEVRSVPQLGTTPLEYYLAARRLEIGMPLDYTQWIVKIVPLTSLRADRYSSRAIDVLCPLHASNRGTSHVLMMARQPLTPKFDITELRLGVCDKEHRHHISNEQLREVSRFETFVNKECFRIGPWQALPKETAGRVTRGRNLLII